MNGIAVVGSRDFILGFKLAGIKNVFIENKIEEKVNNLIAEKKVSIIVINDSDFQKLSQESKRKFSEIAEPIVISVGQKEEEDIREKIKKAIGIDLYKK